MNKKNTEECDNAGFRYGVLDQIFPPAPQTNRALANHTWYQMEVTADYDILVEMFGEPLEVGASIKVRAQWILDLNGKTESCVTIYDWKEYDKDVSEVREWHLGAREAVLAQRVKNFIESQMELALYK